MGGEVGHGGRKWGLLYLSNNKKRNLIYYNTDET